MAASVMRPRTSCLRRSRRPMGAVTVTLRSFQLMLNRLHRPRADALRRDWHNAALPHRTRTHAMIDLTSALRQPDIDTALQDTLLALAACSLDIGRRMRTASIAGVQGSAGQGNVQGEEQRQMDVIANELLKQALMAVPEIGRASCREREERAGGSVTWKEI